MEKTARTIIAAAFGVDGYTNAGLLAIDDIYSAEQVVIDYEIVQYAIQFLRGFDFSEEALSTKIIQEVALGEGNFLSHKSTLNHEWWQRWKKFFMWISIKNRDNH